MEPNNPFVHLSLADYYQRKDDNEKSFEEIKLAFLNPELNIDKKISILLKYFTITEKYTDFKLMLDFFSDVNCEGCRITECQLYENCQVKDCIKNKNIDFCFQCTEFPCKRTGFDEHLEQRWIKINKKLKEIGLEKFHSETKNISRY